MSNFANVYVGSAPNDLTGDTLRHAFEIINLNFANIANGDANITISSPVSSVAGKTGAVYLQVNDVLGAASLANVIAQTNAANTYANVLYATTTSSITANIYAQVEANLATTIAGIASDLVTSGDLLSDVYADIDLVNANVTAANAHISWLTASLGGVTSSVGLLVAANIVQDANLGTATTNISALQDGAIASNSAIATNTNRVNAANVRITVLDANLGVASNNINTLIANAAAQNYALNTLTSNASIQANQIHVLDANLGTATTNITTLLANAGAQSAALTTLTINAASQATQIKSIQANLGTATITISSLLDDSAAQEAEILDLQNNASIQSAQIRTLDANLGIATITNGTQVTAINNLSDRVNAANLAIIQSNVDVVSYVNTLNSAQVTANTIQALALEQIFGNLDFQYSEIRRGWANAATQGLQIQGLIANIGAGNAVTLSYISTNNANVLVLSNQLANVQAGLIAANIYTVGSTTYANASVTAANIEINNLRANITAANLLIAPVSNLHAISSSILPTSSNTYSLGSSTQQWNEIYSSGNIQTTSYMLSGISLLTPLVEAGTLNANAALIYGDAIVGNIHTLNDYSVATLANIITTNGVFWANGSPYVTSNSPIGNVVFTDTTISTADGTTYGIILNSAGSGEIAMQDYVGINNLNPGYWLHIGDGSAGAVNNTGNISVDFNNGTDAAKGSVIFDYAWWQNSEGNNNRGTGNHTHFGIYKNDETHNNKFIEFEYASGNVSLGNIAYTMGNSQNWTTAVTTVGEALDQLAARLKAAGF